MTYQPIPPVNFPSYGNTGTIDISKYTRTGSTYTDPDLFKLMMAQTFTNSFDILLGQEEKVQDSLFGGFNVYGAGASSYFSGLSSSMPSDIAMQTMTPSTISPQVQLIALSYLPGKTVTAYNPLTKQTITGTVESVLFEDGQLVVNIGGTKVLPDYITQISQ